MKKFINNASMKHLAAIQIVLPTLRLHEDFYFILVNVQDEPPLTRVDASNCLGGLVQQVAAVLKRMHELGWAHLDVQLPNICFTPRWLCMTYRLHLIFDLTSTVAHLLSIPRWCTNHWC